MKDLHKHLFWLYGVIIGLAIQNALLDVVPHFLPPPAGEPWSYGLLEGLRLLAFLMVAVRLYLGSVVYYDDTYFGSTRTTASRTEYRRDFIFGLFHFLILFCWAITLSGHDPGTAVTLSPDRPSTFVWLATVVLGFDVIWAFASKGSSGEAKVRLWTAVNVATLVLAWFLWLLLNRLGAGMVAEHFFVLVVIAASGVDINEMIRGRPIFGPSLLRLVHIEPEQNDSAMVEATAPDP